MHNQRLEELNLAHNRISSFRDILNLARLGSLKSLSFSDPHFGDNPICKLCNYQTYVTYHLTQLASLDMEHISDDAKRLARAIYLKKKMYYNMRMKTLKRDATNIITKAQEMHQSKMKGFDDCVRTLLRLQKDMQCCQLRHAEAEAREAGQDEPPLPRAAATTRRPRPTSSRATRARCWQRSNRCRATSRRSSSCSRSFASASSRSPFSARRA